MNTQKCQTFQAKHRPITGPVLPCLSRPIDTDKGQPRLIVTRAILTARNVQRRIQACTPTLMSTLRFDGGENV